MSIDVYGWVNMDEFVWRMKGWSLTPNTYMIINQNEDYSLNHKSH